MEEGEKGTASGGHDEGGDGGGRKKEEDMFQQLISMGFSPKLASTSLSATSSKSILHATDWILSNHHDPQSPNEVEIEAKASAASTSVPGTVQQRKTLTGYFSSLSPKPPPLHPNPTMHDSTVQTPKRQKTVSQSCISEPLSERMRPRGVDEVVGQDHLLGPNSILRSALSRDLLPSLVLWGPPGTGKTSIARAIAGSSTSSYRFVSLSAVTSGVKDVRTVVDDAVKQRKQWKRRTVLFIDEVHRFNRAQLDSFLPAIEDGSIVFIGATTENPSFHLTTPLLSRCRVLALHPLQQSHIAVLLRRAMVDKERGLAASIRPAVTFKIDEEAIDFLSLHCDGDARVALNGLEVAALLSATKRGAESEVTINTDDMKESLQRKHLAYDRAGDEHYNLISALHKSMRGSDPDASIYWLARMLEGGEQPLYIARRLVRFASEDVGLADPFAMTHAVACYQACHFLGMPECDVNLAQCVAYLALAPKSIAAYSAINDAKKMVRASGGGNEGVPLHLRNAPTSLMKDFGYGKDYVYPPSHPNSPRQTFLPPSLHGHKFLHWP